MKRQTEIKLKQLVVIIVAWLILGFIITVYDHLILTSQSAIGPAPSYSFGISALRNMGAGLIGAIIGGSLLVFYVNVRYQHKPYGYTILFVGGIFILIVAFITLVMGLLIVPMRTGKPIFAAESLAALKIFLEDKHPVKNGIVWSIIVATTQLLLQVNSKFGQGAFWDIIRGKYNTPKEEYRIFMFLDLNSSTRMAEQLGNEAYHSLLKDFFADITYPILENKGNIFQYVGDEVVLSWSYEEGFELNRCIQCFFDMKSKIHLEKEKYLSRYNLIPAFKAGMHCGKVIAGEVGIIKRDITYSGDVLNTTSRILSNCNEFKEELVASDHLVQRLKLGDRYQSNLLGAIKLRGKENEVILKSIKQIKYD